MEACSYNSQGRRNKKNLACNAVAAQYARAEARFLGNPKATTDKGAQTSPGSLQENVRLIQQEAASPGIYAHKPLRGPLLAKVGCVARRGYICISPCPRDNFIEIETQLQK